MTSREVARDARVVCRHMKERELEAGVMRFVREIGIAPEGKVRTVGFDLTGAGPVTGAGIALDILEDHQPTQMCQV